MKIELLNSRHDRSAFESGHPALDGWLAKSATQWSRKNLSRVYVATPSSSESVVGYYSLSSHAIEHESLPDPRSKGLPRNVHVPTVLLGKLAVCRSAQGRGLGRLLLFDAMAKCLEIAESVAVAALEVEAVDERARELYEHMGLEKLLDDPAHLFLPLGTIRKLDLVRTTRSQVLFSGVLPRRSGSPRSEPDQSGY